MAHGYGGGPPPPLLHLPPPPPPTLYPSELLWKQRYQPPLHAPLHHAIADDYLAAATYDRERHERLLRDRREQEQREMLEKQQKERKERERIEQERERERERERDREKQEREEKERRDHENAASKLVSRHFEESLRLANQKRERMSWSLLHSLAPSRGAAAQEHERLRAPPPDRAYYSPPGHPSHPAHPPHPATSPAEYHAQHARLNLPSKGDKQSHPSLPKGEPNFGPYNYPYRYDKIKDQHLPAPPPLVPEKNSVIVKHDPKQIHLEQKHPYPSKPRNEPNPHYLPSRTYRTGPSPHAPPHPHPTLQTSPHAALPAQDKNARRMYQPPPPRSPAYYQTAQPVKPKVSSPAPPHIYGKPPCNSPGPGPGPAHYAVAVEQATMPPHSKVEQPPVPYPPPYAQRTRPPPPAHSRTPEPRPPQRALVDSNSTSPCQLQPLDLGVTRDDPDRLSPRRRGASDPPEADAKRRRLEEPTAPEPLIAAAAGTGRTPHGSEPAPQAPGPPCDVRVPSADGSVATPERAAGASPAPQLTPAASPAPSTPVPPVAASPPIAAAPPTAPTPPAPPATPPVSTAADGDTPGKAAQSPRDNGGAPVRHLGKKAWLQRHETAPIGEGDCSGGGGTCITLPMAINRVSEPDDSSSNIVVPVAAKSIQRGTRKATKPRKPKEANGRVEDAEEDSSSSDRESAAPPKRKPPKAKRKKGAAPRKVGDEPKRKKASESGSESDKESDDKDSDSGGSGSGSGSTSSRRAPRPTPSCRTGLASRSRHASPSVASVAGRPRSATRTCRTSSADSTLSED